MGGARGAGSGRLRVVAGSAGGRRLRVPPGRGVRPTVDRVKEAVFAALGDLTGASVLDLFAGSGALALEALSRGAARAVLVERDRAALRAIGENLATTGFERQGRPVARDVHAFLRAPPPREAPFDLVLVDPPYEAGDDDVARVLGALGAPGWLAPGGRVVVERGRTGSVPLPTGWQTTWERRYVDTLVRVAVPGGPPAGCPDDDR